MNFVLGHLYDQAFARGLNPITVPFEKRANLVAGYKKEEMSCRYDQSREGIKVLSSATVPYLVATGAKVMALGDVGLVGESNNVSWPIGDVYLRDVAGAVSGVLATEGDGFLLARGTTGDELAVVCLPGVDLREEKVAQLREKIGQAVREKVRAMFSLRTTQGERCFIYPGMINFEEVDMILWDQPRLVDYHSGDENYVIKNHPEIWKKIGPEFKGADGRQKAVMLQAVNRQLSHVVIERAIRERGYSELCSYREPADWFAHLSEKAGNDKMVMFAFDVAMALKLANSDGGREAGNAVMGILTQAVHEVVGDVGDFGLEDVKIHYGGITFFALPDKILSGNKRAELLAAIERKLSGWKELGLSGKDNKEMEGFFLAAAASIEVSPGEGEEAFFERIDELRDSVALENVKVYCDHFLGKPSDRDWLAFSRIFKPYIETKSVRGSSRRGPNRIYDFLTLLGVVDENEKTRILDEMADSGFYEYSKALRRWELKQDKLEAFKGFAREKIFRES